MRVATSGSNYSANQGSTGQSEGLLNLGEALLYREQLRIGRRGVENGRLGRKHQIEEADCRASAERHSRIPFDGTTGKLQPGDHQRGNRAPTLVVRRRREDGICVRRRRCVDGLREHARDSVPDRQVRLRGGRVELRLTVTRVLIMTASSCGIPAPTFPESSNSALPAPVIARAMRHHHGVARCAAHAGMAGRESRGNLPWRRRRPFDVPLGLEALLDCARPQRDWNGRRHLLPVIRNTRRGS